MAGTICDGLDHFRAFAHCFQDAVGEFEIAAFVVAADVVDLACFAFFESGQHGFAVIVDV